MHVHALREETHTPRWLLEDQSMLYYLVGCHLAEPRTIIIRHTLWLATKHPGIAFLPKYSVFPEYTTFGEPHIYGQRCKLTSTKFRNGKVQEVRTDEP